MQEYQNVKTRLHSKLLIRSFIIKKVKNFVPWIYVISEETVATVLKRNCKKSNQEKR